MLWNASHVLTGILNKHLCEKKKNIYLIHNHRAEKDKQIHYKSVTNVPIRGPTHFGVSEGTLSCRCQNP